MIMPDANVQRFLVSQIKLKQTSQEQFSKHVCYFLIQFLVIFNVNLACFYLVDSFVPSFPHFVYHLLYWRARRTTHNFPLFLLPQRLRSFSHIPFSVALWPNSNWSFVIWAVISSSSYFPNSPSHIPFMSWIMLFIIFWLDVDPRKSSISWCGHWKICSVVSGRMTELY